MNKDFCTPDFSLLPAHIITHILRYLEIGDFKNASSVCKSWHYASTDPQIVRTLAFRPAEEDFPGMCKSKLRFGILKLWFLDYDKVDSYYFELFEKFGRFIHEIQIFDSDLKIHHLLKLFEFTTGLESFSFSHCRHLAQLPGLFPLDYDFERKSRILKNLTGVKSVTFDYFNNIPLVMELVRFTPNLETFAYSNYSVPVEDFINGFVNIQNLNLRSLKIALFWDWRDGIFKSSLYRQFILKLHSLVEFSINELSQEQLSLICQHLLCLKSFDCILQDSVQATSELANLKQLEKLHCSWSYNNNRYVNLIEINKFFKCEFNHLRIFNFDEFVTESNLVQLCEIHSNLIELKLPRLVTRNLEIIFKYLTKLRVLNICFGFEILTPEVRHSLKDMPELDSNREYEFKISRLHDLEEFHLDELVNGIRMEDVQQLKKLRITNLSELFSKQA